MRKMWKWSALGLMLGILTACGQAPSTAPKALREKADRAPIARHSAVPGQVTPAMQEGERLKQGALQAFTRASGFEAEIQSYGEGRYKMGEKVSELRKSSSRTKLTFVKPCKIRGEIIETTNPLLEGGKMATADGENITARAKGILGLFPIRVKASEPKMRNNRNHHFKEGMPDTLIARLTGPGSVWTVVGETQVAGVPVRMVEVAGVRRLDKELTRELLGIDPTTFQIRKVSMYAGETRVIDYTFKTFRWNPKVTASTFQL